MLEYGQFALPLSLLSNTEEVSRQPFPRVSHLTLETRLVSQLNHYRPF